MIRLHLESWRCEWDQENLLYFEIRDGDKTLWSSQWHDLRDEALVNDLRKEVEAASRRFGMSCSLESDDFGDWTGKTA